MGRLEPPDCGEANPVHDGTGYEWRRCTMGRLTCF